MLLTGLFCGILLGFVMQRGRFCISIAQASTLVPIFLRINQ